MASKNLAKASRYAFAWDRIAEAMKAGFHLESITICESIIADRLLSHALYCDKKVDARTPFARLIAAAREVEKTVSMECRATLTRSPHPCRLATEDLFADLDQWRGSRNELLHGLAKSMPRAPMTPVDSVHSEARECAEQGEVLARLVLRWHQKRMRGAGISRRPRKGTA